MKSKELRALSKIRMACLSKRIQSPWGVLNNIHLPFHPSSKFSAPWKSSKKHVGLHLVLDLELHSLSCFHEIPVD